MYLYKVSVIIPTYKRTRYLKRAIESVIHQTYKNIEIIVVDDNVRESKEQMEVRKMCKEYSVIAELVYIQTGGCVGGGKARNLGCKYAKGEYFAFLDDDDIFLPDKIEAQLKFTVNNNLDMSFQDVVWFNEKNEIVEHRKFDYITDFSNENLLKQHLLHNIAPTSIYFISRKAFEMTCGFGEIKVGQDIYLMFDCIIKNLKIAYMPGAYVYQYLHKGERVSLGKNKIVGENWWYHEKQKYLYILNKKEKRFFVFRHYIILLFACIRSSYWFRAIYYMIIALLISPILSLKEGYRYLSEKKRCQKEAEIFCDLELINRMDIFISG